jgi:hypothetical protein
VLHALTGTPTAALMKPFTDPVTLGPSNGTVTYSAQPPRRDPTAHCLRNFDHDFVEIVPGEGRDGNLSFVLKQDLSRILVRTASYQRPLL